MEEMTEWLKKHYGKRVAKQFKEECKKADTAKSVSTISDAFFWEDSKWGYAFWADVDWHWCKEFVW